MKSTAQSIGDDSFKFGIGKALRGTLAPADLAAVFSALENFQREIKEQDKAKEIIRITQRFLSGLDLFQTMAFYLVDTESLDFTLELCDPESKKARIDALYNSAIDSGKFSWALRQRDSVFVSAPSGRKNDPAMFHCLRSSKETVGMFCGLLKKERVTSNETSFSLLSILLGISADALTGVRTTDDLNKKIQTAGRDLRLSIEHANQMARQAQEASEAKSRFLASMSHEIRTPMNAVIGVTGLLLDTRLSPQQLKYAQTVRAAGESLLFLINDILDFSKIEAGKTELEVIDFELRTAVSEAVELVRVNAQQKGLSLECDFDPGLPGHLTGDPARLRQILVNLMGNAVKFTTSGGVFVSVALEKEDDSLATVRFQVRDTGIGIPQNRIDRLFQSFSQVDASTNRKFGGTGLGLAICKRLVEMMRGHIWVESREGAGSEFNFTIILNKLDVAADGPGLRRAEHHKPATCAPLARPLTAEEKSKIHILLAEDNTTNQMVALAMLKKAGFSTDVAANGLEVIEALKTVPYDLILMDIQMPEMDGMETTRAIRNSAAGPGNSTVPIVAMTAHAMKGYSEQCLEAGMNDYVSKPVRAEDLVAAIERQITGRISAPRILAEPAAGCPEIFEWEEVKARLGADDQVLHEILSVFIGDFPDQLYNIQRGLGEKNATLVERHAHSLKGAAGLVGACEVSKTAEKIEYAGRAKDFGLAESLLPLLREEFARLQTTLKAHGL